MTAAEPAHLYPSAPSPGPAPLTIALLGYRSHPFVGGQGIYLKYLSRALAHLGHTVHVYSGPPYPELDEGIALIKVPSLDLYAEKSHIRALRPRHLLSFTDFYEWWTMLSGGFAEPYTFGRRLLRVLPTNTYDIVHDNQSLCSALLALQARGENVVSTIHHPIHRDRELALATLHAWGDRLLVKRWYSFLSMQENVARRLAHVVTVSRVSQRDIAAHFQRACAHTPVIGNGIDTATFRPRPNIARNPLRLITTASADQPLKGLRHLLQAVHSLRASLPGVHLRVVGKLKTGGATEALLERLQLRETVSFVSGISTEQLVEEYARASVAVCPSLYEGFGLPAGEAMACGLPLVATDGGALPEVVGDAGIVVPAGDSAALASAILNLLSNPAGAAALGQQARARIEQQFCWHTVARELTRYYHGMLSRESHRAHR